MPLRPFGERGELDEMLAYLDGVFEVGEPSAPATVWTPIRQEVQAVTCTSCARL